MLLERLYAKLRAIPALGVCKKLTYEAAGVVKRVYNPLCFLISYDGIDQLIALNQYTWDHAVKHAMERNLTNKHLKDRLGKFSKNQYEVKQGSRTVTYDAWCCLVENGGCKFVLALSPSELKCAIEYGLKVSEQNPKFRINWFKSLIRKIGLWFLLG